MAFYGFSVFQILALISFFNILVVNGCEEGTISPDPDNCEAFFVCNHGKKLKYTCANGLFFNPSKQVCDWSDNVNCGKVTTTTKKPVTNGVISTAKPAINFTTTMKPIVNPHQKIRFAPYFDVNLKAGPTLPEVFAATGQKTFTLAFVLGSSEGCVPKWGAANDLDDPEIINPIREIQAAGGEFIVATGGAVGPYIEHTCTTVDSLAAAYTKILDTVRTNHIDVDVEAPINTDMVNQALAKVQKERPQTTVSYTLMVQAEDYGLNPPLGTDVLKSAKKNGVRVDIVNPMTMEFSGSSADWGDAVIGAAKSVLRNMKEVWPEKSDAELKSMLGVTPMIGRNFNGKRFEVVHGKKLVQWASDNHIGLLAFWSVARDNGKCAGGGISPSCSSVSQNEYEFTKIFQQFKG